MYLMRGLLLFLFLLFSLNLFAQDTVNVKDAAGRRQGYWQRLDTAGRKIYEGHFKDNIPVGEFRYYYPNGKIKVINIMSDNGHKAHSTAFFQGGYKMAEGIYIDEKRDSTWRFYSEYDGKLVSEETYKGGVKDGYSLTYYGGEGLAEKSSWKNGVMDGPWEQYYTDGKIRIAGNYRNGLRDGQVKTFYDSGQVMMDGQYIEGDPDGTWFYYDENGKLIKKETYKGGKLTGTEEMK